MMTMTKTMLLSPRTAAVGIDTPSIEPSSTLPRPPKLAPARVSRTLIGKGKGIRRPWADGPWPLIEAPSRTQRLTSTPHHIADELAHAHNAMLRGLNAMYLQAAGATRHGRADVADLLFLGRAWSGWVLAHHRRKEDVVLPALEAALALAPGSLMVRSLVPIAVLGAGRLGKGGRRGDKGKGKLEQVYEGDEDEEREEGEEGRERGKEGADDDITLLLQRVHAYAATTQADPASYSASTLRAHLVALAAALVPHLHNQVALLARIQDPCSSSPAPSPSASSSSSSSTSSFNSNSTTSHPSSSSPAHALTRAYLSPTPSLASDYICGDSDIADQFVIAPLITGLRDATYDGGGRSNSHDQKNVWPRLSVPALHAVADRLSARHAGAWRFLPCDVWGRPRELAFLGES
ncbi:hypothetical protein GGR52DRAFT_127933 [Hypoxylon sp. FL1284]|nr:hypothetical protein GGR52DRAFT_127933 [Hypoxylon sp. FL1284]